MKGNYRRKYAFLIASILTLAVMTIWSAPAEAYVFGWDDMYYIASSTDLHTVFGAGSGPYVNANFYQNEADSYVGWTPYVFRTNLNEFI
ncbi:MAG TPA: hypothetical protein VMT62_14160 [Syntrophorhabdaceae bacterium]|nr:hypothetical protein [Syntrophorhabdaceae bacterium]